MPEQESGQSLDEMLFAEYEEDIPDGTEGEADEEPEHRAAGCTLCQEEGLTVNDFPQDEGDHHGWFGDEDADAVFLQDEDPVCGTKKDGKIEKDHGFVLWGR